MTNNDYIAEYVKERYPSILGINFALWRIERTAVEMGNCIAEAIKNVNKEDLKKYLEESEVRNEKKKM